VERYYGGRRAAAVAEADEAVRLARDIGDTALRGRVLNNLVIANWFPGRDAARLAALDESLSLSGSGLPGATEAVALVHRASLRLRYADIRGYEQDLGRASWLIPRLLRDELDGQLSALRGGNAILRGEFGLARELADDAHTRFARTTLWGAGWTLRIMQASIARLDGSLPDVVDTLVSDSEQDSNRILRWTAVLALAETGRLREARSHQARWGLRLDASAPHWASQLEWIQAAEIALLLDSPNVAELYGRLGALSGQLVDVGTGLAVWGPVDDVLSRLADRLGEPSAAARHRDEALRITDRVGTELGGSPGWTARG
jgi:hypothetical protein